MKHTGLLQVAQGDAPGGKTLRIHPNDGFDLGLMTDMYQMQIFNNCTAEDFNNGNGTSFHGTVEQVNECKAGTMQVNFSTGSKLKLPEWVRLVCIDNKLLILHCNGKSG